MRQLSTVENRVKLKGKDSSTTITWVLSGSLVLGLARPHMCDGAHSYYSTCLIQYSTVHQMGHEPMGHVRGGL